jgi:type IV pilus assembly protein PilF
MNNFMQKNLTVLIKSTILTVMLCVLSACVTTERGGSGTKADKQKALEYTVQLARTYIRDGNWDGAKRHLKVAQDMDGQNAEVHEALGLVFQNTGELERADASYQKAIRLDSKLSRVRNNYAAFLYQQGRYSEAVKQLEVVVDDTLYERRSSAYMNLGRCYVRLDDFNKAEAAYKRSYLMDRRNVMITLEMAEVYFALQNFSEAQRYYDGFRQQVRQQPSRALWLGIRLADKFDDADAMSSYVLALKNLYPHSEEYLQYKKVYSNDG